MNVSEALNRCLRLEIELVYCSDAFTLCWLFIVFLQVGPKTRDGNSTLAYCWTIVCNANPTLKQH